MTFLQLAGERHSVRKYRNIPVEKEKIMAVLEAGRIAPSAVNFQPWYFVVVTDQEVKNRLGEAYRSIPETPVAIVVCGDHSMSWKRRDGKDHCDIDMAIAVDHMTLQATELGLGTCWVCAFDAKVCSSILGLPGNIEPVAIIRMGYSAEGAAPAKDRKALDEIVCWNGFDKQ